MPGKHSKVTKTAKRASKLALGENLDISGVAKLHIRLKACTVKDTDVNLNSEKVLSIDTSSLQLLLTFVQQVVEDGHSVNWQKPSEALLKTAALAGLAGNLGLASVADLV